MAGRELCPVWVWTAPRVCVQCHRRAGTQGTVVPCHLSIFPMCTGVLVLPKHTPALPLHTGTWITWLLLAFTCCQCHAGKKPLQWCCITCGQTGDLFSSTSFLTSEAGLIQPLIESSQHPHLPAGFHGRTVRWIRNWLDGHVQRATVSSPVSKWK